MPAVAALGVGQLVDLDEAGLLDALEHQLRDPVAALQPQLVHRIVIDHDHLDLTPISRIDRARRIDQ